MRHLSLILIGLAHVCAALQGHDLSIESVHHEQRRHTAADRKILQDDQPKISCDQPGLFTFMVSLKTAEGRHLCGGALFRKRWVVTAARCVDPAFWEEAVLLPKVSVAGLTEDTAAETLQTIKTFVPDEWNGDPRNGFDLALLKLDKKSCMKPIPIAGKNFKIPTVDPLIFMGWGRLGSTGAFTSRLQVANMTYIEMEECRMSLVRSDVTKEMVCTKGVTTEGLCQGDEGSPLMYFPTDPELLQSNKFPFKLVGIGSFSDIDCTDPEGISLFSSIPKLSKWIRKTVKDNE